MSSTVTSSTMATVLKMASVSPDHLVALVVPLVIALAFLALAIQKEIFGTPTSSSRWSLASRGLNIGLVPLGITFLLVVVDQILRINAH